MAIFTPGMEIWLLGTERALRERLTSGDIPFLGLYSDLFTESSRRKLRETLSGLRDPLSTYLKAMEKWPATFTAYLTIHVVEGFGTSGDAAVYPFVCQAIFGSVNTLSQAERDVLWQSYRRACIRLGLDVVPKGSAANYMVAEYLHQAGVPLNFLPRIAARMLRHAAVAGVPDPDEPQGIALWQTTLIDRLGPPIPLTARRAIESDRGGYYTRLFLRVLGGEPADPTGCDRSIYDSLAEALAAEDTDRNHVLGRRLTIPKVMLRDDLIGVELPAGEGAGWRIAVDGESCAYEGKGEPHFVPFDFPLLPGSVRIERADGQWYREFELWQDGRNNRLLAFDSGGMLAGSSKLNVEEGLAVEPGRTTLFTRFRPTGYEGELIEISPEPALYRLDIDLVPGELVRLQRGTAQLSIFARSHPTLALHGEAFRGIGGNELYASEGLVLHGHIPQELLDGADSGALQLELSTPELSEPVTRSVDPDPSGAFEIALSEVCRGWVPGLTRLNLLLRRGGQRRPIARTAAWLWNGLEHIKERVRFQCARLPSNLDRDASDNLAIDESHTRIQYRSDEKRYFHLVFAVAGGRLVRFVGAVPGAFLVLVRFRDGQVLEQPLRRGVVLAVREGSREVLDCYSSQGGVLTLGEMRQEISPRSGMKRLHLSSLAQYLQAGTNRLRIVLPDGSDTPLLQLVAPHRVLKMTSATDAGIMRIRLDLPAAADLVRCSAVDVLTGQEHQLDVSSNDVESRLAGGTLVWLDCGERRPDGSYRHNLELPLERWGTGAWLLQVEARLNGRWGLLVNGREDVYGWGFVLDESGAPATRSWIPKNLVGVETRAATAIFRRVHRALLPCYAPDAWPTLDWLGQVWGLLVRALPERDTEVMTELLGCDASRPPDTGQQSWFPLLTPGAVVPWIYARSIEAYRGVGARARLIGELARITAPLCTLFLDHWLEPTAAIGFDNVRAMQRGVPPSGFSMRRYRQAMAMRNIDDAWSLLSREDWRPAAGDYLGPVHWRFALGSMQTRYRATLPGNESRRGWALRLLRATSLWTLGRIADGLPAHLNVRDGLGGLDLRAVEPDEETLNLAGIDRLLCLFAAVCRWEVRRPGTLDAWRRKLESVDLPDTKALELALGYLLRVGRDCFEFYLLLWELIFAADAPDADAQELESSNG